MRAVLRATFAARRKARPTAAENSLLICSLAFGFMAIFPIILDCGLSYHIRSKYLLKAGSAALEIAAVQRFNHSKVQRQID
jgi:hypothetical protein